MTGADVPIVEAWLPMVATVVIPTWLLMAERELVVQVRFDVARKSQISRE